MVGPLTGHTRPEHSSLVLILRLIPSPRIFKRSRVICCDVAFVMRKFKPNFYQKLLVYVYNRSRNFIFVCQNPAVLCCSQNKPHHMQYKWLVNLLCLFTSSFFPLYVHGLQLTQLLHLLRLRFRQKMNHYTYIPEMHSILFFLFTSICCITCITLLPSFACCRKTFDNVKLDSCFFFISEFVASLYVV